MKSLLPNIPKLVSIKPTNPMSNLRIHSHSILDAVNTCPMWGVVRYGHKKAYAQSGRSMALEAGHAMHEVFAACRLWQLGIVQGHKDRAWAWADHLYGHGRWPQCFTPKDDPREELLVLCFNILNSSEFYDDPNDKIRTISNMELATVRYVDEHITGMANWPVYIDDRIIGVEQVFDITLTYENDDQVRYIGTIDAILQSVRRENRVFLGENKTASRPDDTWRKSFEMSHQVSGYSAGCAVLLNDRQFVADARVFGIKVKQSGHDDDYAAFNVTRTWEFIVNWAAWVYHSAQMLETYIERYEDTPRYTHSCNRYFRPCSLIPFCGDTTDGRKEQFYKDMVVVQPTPSEQRIIRQHLDYA